MTIGVYQNRRYVVQWYGRTRGGELMCKLAIANGASCIWADATKVRIDGVAASLRIESAEIAKAEQLEASLYTDGDPASVPTLLPLDPYQVGAVDYVLRVKNAIIADEMGLGKSCESLGVLAKTNAYPALIITPATIKYSWQREVLRFIGHESLVLGRGLPSDDDLCDMSVIIVNYESVDTHLDWLIHVPFRTLIVDESHYIKSSKARRSKNVIALSKIESLEYKMALTGTPIMNRPAELANQLIMLGALVRDKKEGVASLGHEWAFKMRYCGPRKTYGGHWDFSGASNLKELAVRMRQNCLIRRDKSQVLAQLPPKRRAIIPVRLSNLAEYDEIDKRFRHWLAPYLRARPDLQAMSPKDRLEKLEQIANAETIMQISAFRDAIAIGKAATAIAWISDFLESGEKLVVFAYHRSLQDALITAFPDALRIFSNDSAIKRDNAVQAFQNDESKKLIICSLGAGGVGITLTASSNLLMCEYDWTPSNMEQAEDRIHRRGQQTDYPVTIWYLHAEHTFDDIMAERLKDKRAVVSTVLDRPNIKGITP